MNEDLTKSNSKHPKKLDFWIFVGLLDWIDENSIKIQLFWIFDI
jgi:hypothetical protein